MKNNASPQAAGSVSASILGGAMLCNPFLAVEDDLYQPVAKLLPVSGLRTDCVTLSDPVLRVVGLAEMTATNCNLFRKTASAAWNGHTDVEIDLSQTIFMDCAGLGALIAVGKLTHERHGVARLMNPTSSVQQLLELTRTWQLFEIVNAPETDLAFAVSHHN